MRKRFSVGLCAGGSGEELLLASQVERGIRIIGRDSEKPDNCLEDPKDMVKNNFPDCLSRSILALE